MPARPRDAIREMVEREREAWDRQDATALAGLFHPDMVWSWPSGDGAGPVVTSGLDRERWRETWQALFASHELVRNERSTELVHVEENGDEGFAVVDVDALWQRRETGEVDHWQGRTVQMYAKRDDQWEKTAHWRLADIERLGQPAGDPASAL